MLRSTDGGKTFKKVSDVVNAPLIRGKAELEGRLVIEKRRHGRGDNEEAGESQGQAFVYSPEREIRYNEDVKKGTPDVAITTLRGAYLSSDNGSTWQRLDGGLIAHSFWGIRWVKGYSVSGIGRTGNRALDDPGSSSSAPLVEILHWRVQEIRRLFRAGYPERVLVLCII